MLVSFFCGQLRRVYEMGGYMQAIVYLTVFLLFSCSFAVADNIIKQVNYFVDGKPYTGLYISPANSAPLVFLVHDWDGLTDYEMKRAEMLAEKGYAVFAADLFGTGIRPTELEEKKRLTATLYDNRPLMRKLLYGALEAARKQGANVDNSVGMGYCFGGSAILELARSGAPLKGFVTFHGGLNLPEGQDYKAVKGKILVFHGSADTNVTLQDFANLAELLEEEHITHEMTTYSGAPHAFTVFGSPAYREEADKLSWERFCTFLKETL